MEFPELTQQPIKHIDGTPDEGYVMRILEVYLENCNCNWKTSDSDKANKLWEEMNKINDERKILLNKAIAILNEI